MGYDSLNLQSLLQFDDNRDYLLDARGSKIKLSGLSFLQRLGKVDDDLVEMDAEQTELWGFKLP